ncbi:CheY-like chemotaxis protein [Paraburkholderia terricola]|uniref:response regulator receiver protein n=1 Tax=Paraburkholderia terricola TaxID=169427 RepID=UPI00286186EC|nr:response regulator receiver protein [Paraburkholderia terricola]MDR6449658.1 CheY-like chemotaxis protein [Paraburkholderia terricola]
MFLPSMSKRPPHADEGQFALWCQKRPTGAVDSESVVVAHADVPVGESIALLLRLKGFVAVATPTMERLDLMVEHWKPRVLLIDTRLCLADDFRFVRRAASDAAFSRVLLVAMTNVFPGESARDIRQKGFDRLVRRPCEVWRIASLLDGLSHPGPTPDRH